MLPRLKTALPLWMHDWLDIIVPGVQIVLIVLAALLLQRLLLRIIMRASDHYQFPHELLTPINAVVRWLILGSAGLLVLERLGVSAAVLWTAFTGFATVGAVAFFAAWSVLTNIFCAFLIMATRPFRLHDWVELLEDGERAGLRGRVRDLTLIYTTLEERHADGNASLLRVPNSMFFQRAVRRWDREPPPRALEVPSGNGGRRRTRMGGGGAGAADDRD